MPGRLLDRRQRDHALHCPRKVQRAGTTVDILSVPCYVIGTIRFQPNPYIGHVKRQEVSVLESDDVLEIRRRPLAYRIVLWLFVAFSATILIVSRTQPALAADMKGHHSNAPHSSASAQQSDKGRSNQSHAAAPASDTNSSSSGASSGGNQKSPPPPAKNDNSSGPGAAAARNDPPSDEHAQQLEQKNDPGNDPEHGADGESVNNTNGQSTGPTQDQASQQQ